MNIQPEDVGSTTTEEKPIKDQRQLIAEALSSQTHAKLVEVINSLLRGAVEKNKAGEIFLSKEIEKISSDKHGDMVITTRGGEVFIIEAKSAAQSNTTDSSDSYLEGKIDFVYAMLDTLIKNDQDAEIFAKEIGIPLRSVKDWMSGTTFPEEHHLARIRKRYFPSVLEPSDASTVQVHILEEPLMLSTIATAFTTLTELSTKYWLIAQDRFADLVEYGQTHDERFVREAGVTIGRVTHNSPFNIDIKLSAPDVASALTTTIDGVSQTGKRLALKELEVQTQALQLKQAEQQAEHAQQMDELAREQQRLTVEQQRLEILEKRLDLQKKAFENALELAERAVDVLRPGLDPAARAMAIQEVLPNILQLQSIPGLELLPPLPKDTNAETTIGNP